MNFVVFTNQQAKEVAEKKAREVTSSVESLSGELQREKQMNNSAVAMAKKACKENEAIKRAIRSVGCKVNFSSTGDCTLDMENYPMSSSSRSNNKMKHSIAGESKSLDLSVSVSVTGDDHVLVSSDTSLESNQGVCEKACPFRPRDGGCRWPEAGCAQFGSQFVGLKANFDAFDRLSIYDGYFDSEKL